MVGRLTGSRRRHLRGRVLGGHGRRQVVALRLEAAGVGPVGDGVADAVVACVAVLALDSIARLGVRGVGVRLARLGDGDVVLGLETAPEI